MIPQDRNNSNGIGGSGPGAAAFLGYCAKKILGMRIEILYINCTLCTHCILYRPQDVTVEIEEEGRKPKDITTRS